MDPIGSANQSARRSAQADSDELSNPNPNPNPNPGLGLGKKSAADLIRRRHFLQDMRTSSAAE